MMVNFLALGGWSPDGDRERISVQELVEVFAVHRSLVLTRLREGRSKVQG